MIVLQYARSEIFFITLRNLIIYLLYQFVLGSGLMVGSELGTQGQAVVLVESDPHGEQTNAEPEARSST